MPIGVGTPRRFTGISDYQVAKATFDAATAQWPKSAVKLRQGNCRGTAEGGERARADALARNVKRITFK